MLKTRILTALVLLGMFIPALFMLPQLWWAGLMMALTLLCLQEWAGFIRLSRWQANLYLLICGVSGLFLLVWLSQTGFHGFFYHTMRILMLAATFWCVVVPISLYFNYFPKNQILGLLVGWALMMALWMSLVVAKTLNPNLLLVVISTVWLADSAAYFTGKNFGKHKLAPAISPGKTWEGVLGALCAVTVYASLLKIFHAVSTWWVLPCLWVITIVGIYGDLFESYFKRRAQLKDSGQILPGHGGLLDRIDGVIPALPVGLCLVFWFHYLKQSYSF